jgi:hypothetical protein
MPPLPLIKATGLQLKPDQELRHREPLRFCKNRASRYDRRGYGFPGTFNARSPDGLALDWREMDLELAGRSVLITGGSGGIGLATARAFAAE